MQQIKTKPKLQVSRSFVAKVTPFCFQRGFFLRSIMPMYVCFALLAAVAFAVRAILARGGAVHVSLPHALVLQSALSLPILAITARVKKTSLLPGRVPKKDYVWRIISSVGYTLVLLYSLKIMPAILASALSYTAPLFTALLAPYLLREKSTPAIILVTVVGFIGLGITAEPYLHEVPMRNIGIGLLCGLAGASLQMSLRKLAAAGEKGVCGVFWTHVTGLVLGASICLVTGNFHFTKLEFVIGLFIALAQVIGQLSNAAAYASGRALAVNAISFLTLPFTLVMAVLLLGEQLTILAILGILITLPSCFALVWLEQAHLRQLHDEKAVLTAADISEEHVQVEVGALGVGNKPFVTTEPSSDEITDPGRASSIKIGEQNVSAIPCL